jgi:hypothetical protein
MVPQLSIEDAELLRSGKETPHAPVSKSFSPVDGLSFMPISLPAAKLPVGDVKAASSQGDRHRKAENARGGIPHPVGSLKGDSEGSDRERDADPQKKEGSKKFFKMGSWIFWRRDLSLLQTSAFG